MRMILTASLSVLLTTATLIAASGTFPAPTAAIPQEQTRGKQTAVFAGGCFWCTEAVFEPLAGVEKVISGYAGGRAEDAKYNLVSEGRTGHAEAIEITYDPRVISYAMLLKVFFSVAHDPTQVDRQGPDWGRQYRSAIFAGDPEQQRVATAYIAQLNAAKVFHKPIATQVQPLERFYPAEAYHQDFVRQNANHPYVVVNARPKVAKLKEQYGALLKK